MDMKMVVRDLKLCRETLCEPNPAIVDTIWLIGGTMSCTTVVDVLDHIIEQLSGVE